MDGVKYDAIRFGIDESPLSTAQILAISTAILLAAVDGFDVLSITFVAPALKAAWGLQLSTIGLLLASGLFGMAVGSLLLAPVADLIGRRPLILGSLAIILAGMLLSGYSRSLTQMLGGRLLAGLGIGACVAVRTSRATELTNARWRALTFSLISMGFPVGGAIGGLLAATLLQISGWQSVFLAGSAATVLLFVAATLFLPESLAFLLASRSPNRIARVNSWLLRYGQPPIASSPSLERAKRGYSGVFSPAQIGTTTWIVAVQLLLVLAFNFFNSWLPQFVAETGLTMVHGSLASSVANAAGIVGGLTFGLVARAHAIRSLGATSMIGAGLALAALGIVPLAVVLVLAVAALVGFLMYAAATAFYAVVGGCFPAEARASGVGFVLGIGRLGGAAAPALAGVFFSAGLGRGAVAAIFGLCAAAAGILLLTRSSRPVI